MTKNETIQYYEGAYADEFPIGAYFRNQFNSIPSSLRYDYSFHTQRPDKLPHHQYVLGKLSHV